ncbi:MAG: hypothetical protein Q9170_001398 [Blastenia crenularia]
MAGLMGKQVLIHDPGSDVLSFGYSPLDVSEDHFRLLQILPGSDSEPIRCELLNTPISKAGYVALSYQWGSLEGPNSIQVNGGRLFVSRNLYGFLNRARELAGSTKLWIDAISIDQTNLLERNDQVRHMDQIFATAREVWVWLGPFVTCQSDTPDPHARRLIMQEALDRMLETKSGAIPALSSTSISGMFDLPKKTRIPLLRENARAKIQDWRAEGDESWLRILVAICHLSYWNRLWITREFLKARPILVWIVEVRISGGELAAFIEAASDSSSIYPGFKVAAEIRNSRAYDLCH